MSGFSVDVERLTEFAQKASELLADLEDGASSEAIYSLSGVNCLAFGNFEEAQDIEAQYESLRSNLREMLASVHTRIERLGGNVGDAANLYTQTEDQNTATQNQTWI
ncbi:hypothetical protein [Allostreptomyces psammosilenae]|uniref:DNA-binding ferritin-like protein n=1 Tax=Allostreptomyces psammosilenae TaxID=1892865 RepID=A0A853A6F0_9ACTN|nr:hypothetical protein [Allostreptomyces psammosilenae]NYI06251.1 DNA-binding ferritin-like protein [Allostreptomyces psammosilenae]